MLRFDPRAAAVWLLAFALVAFLSLRGGGYEPVLRGEVGIAIWWIVLIGVLAGILPLRRPGRAGALALGALAAYAVWSALSVTWSESPERTVADVGRVAVYLGVFALALCIRAANGARRLVGALGAAIAVVGLVALASRLHPAWFPGAAETASFLPGARSRLGYPLDFWNGLAALLAIGLPLVLSAAASARSELSRVLATAALPALVLALFFTFSRGGTVAALLGLAYFVALAPDRVATAVTGLIAALGAAVLVLAASQRNALEGGLLNEAARQQGDEMLAMTIVVCAGVGLLKAGLSLAGFDRGLGARPRWAPRRGVGLALTAATVALAAVAVDLPERTADAWSEFKGGGTPGGGAGRLESFQGNGRYQFWEAAVDQAGSAPLLGTGSGTYEYWWAREGSAGGFVRDAHSLYLETLGELGIVGFLLLLALIAVVLVGGCSRALRAPRARRGPLAAAVAGCLAFCVAAAFDWVWELPAIPVAFFLLASVLVTAGDRAAVTPGLTWRWRAGVASVSVAAISAIAIPLASTALLRESQAAVRAGDLAGALADARTAGAVQPYAASPLIQEALVLELEGRLGAAAGAAAKATEREPTNWRTWLILSRLEAKRGRVDATIEAYREARRLNPRSALFAR